MDCRLKLVHAVTEYDRKESTKKFYNRYALAMYLQAISNIEADVLAGVDLRKAIVSYLNGRLMNACLKAVGLNPATDQELKFGN